MANHIEYIDALRGFAMLLVVLFHVPIYCYHQTDEITFSMIPSIFHLALFFFISGWFCKIRSIVSWRLVQQKFLQLIVPTVVFYLLYCWLQDIDIIDNLWSDKFKAGYWFCIVLFCFNLLMIVLGRLKGRGGEIFGVSVSLCAMMLNTNAVTRLLTELNIPNVLCVQQWQYFIFFYMGNLAHRYQEHIFVWLDNGRIMAISVLLFFGSLLVYYKQPMGLFEIKTTFILWGGLGTILSFAFFRKYKDIFCRKTYVGRTLQYIGRRTLDVYLLQFFFLPKNLSGLGAILMGNGNQTVELFVSFVIAMMVVALSLLMGIIIRLSPTLAYWTLGQKRDQKKTSSDEI